MDADMTSGFCFPEGQKTGWWPRLWETPEDAPKQQRDKCSCN